MGESDQITPELLLKAYASGIFPMADSAEAEELFWYAPEERGVIPLEDLHLPRKLRKRINRRDYKVTANFCFNKVIRACADCNNLRPSTWINGKIIALCEVLHELGFAHSVEIWIEDELAGGLYGVALGGAFFGESMFHRKTDASKLAFAHLALGLRQAGFQLLDSQFVTDHLRQFGAVEIPKARYLTELDQALRIEARFPTSEALEKILP